MHPVKQVCSHSSMNRHHICISKSRLSGSSTIQNHPPPPLYTNTKDSFTNVNRYTQVTNVNWLYEDTTGCRNVHITSVDLGSWQQSHLLLVWCVVDVLLKVSLALSHGFLRGEEIGHKLLPTLVNCTSAKQEKGWGKSTEHKHSVCDHFEVKTLWHSWWCVCVCVCEKVCVCVAHSHSSLNDAAAAEVK